MIEVLLLLYRSNFILVIMTFSVQKMIRAEQSMCVCVHVSVKVQCARRTMETILQMNINSEMYWTRTACVCVCSYFLEITICRF